MTKRKRRHHYIPCYYLKHFANPRARSGKIYVIDCKRAAFRPSIVEQVGYEKGYFSVEGNLPPDDLENSFASVEGEIASAWDEMILGRAFPSDPRKVDLVMNVVTMLSCRTPARRASIQQFYARSYQALTDVVYSRKEIFEKQIGKIREKDPTLAQQFECIGLDEIRNSYLEGKIRIEAHIPNNFFITQTAEISGPLHNMFHDRIWRLIDLAGIGVEMITSDDPVCCCWPPFPTLLPTPGFGMLGSLAILPVSPNLVLIGAYDDSLLRFDSSEQVARWINRMLIEQSFHFLYSRSGRFDSESISGDAVHRELLLKVFSTIANAGREQDSASRKSKIEAIDPRTGVLVHHSYRDEFKICQIRRLVSQHVERGG